MKTLPEYQAFFMKTPYGMDFKAMGANSYNVQAHIPRTDLQHYSQFVSQRFLSSYQRYSKEYEKYEKTYNEDNKKKEIRNCKQRKKARYNKEFCYEDIESYSFWFVIEKTEDGFEIKYWSNNNKGTQGLNDDINEESIQKAFVNAYIKCLPGMHYSYNSNKQINDNVWELEQFVEEALTKTKVLLNDNKWVSHLTLLIELIRLSKHAYFNLENAESAPLPGPEDISAHIVYHYAVYVKEHENITDDEFVINALRICAYAGLISVLVWKKNVSNIDYTLYKNAQLLLDGILAFGPIQKWEELLLAQNPVLKEVNYNQQLLYQIIATLQFTYILTGKVFESSQNMRQLEESYCAMYEYGQLLGMYFELG